MLFIVPTMLNAPWVILQFLGKYHPLCVWPGRLCGIQIPVVFSPI